MGNNPILEIKNTFDKIFFDKLNLSCNNDLYYLYIDEGGMFGLPKIIMSKKNKSIENFADIGKLKSSTIYKYILGRLSYRQLGGFNSLIYLKAESFLSIK